MHFMQKFISEMMFLHFMQKIVQRREYLDRLLQGKDRTDVVKVITGMRRSGKSTLMKQYYDLLQSDGVSESNIVFINFESSKFYNIQNYTGIIDFVNERYHQERIYVLLDEIQRVDSWEKAVNSLLVDFDADMYITGSNGYLLSSELATYLSGRYIQIKILPLSFKEYIELHPGDANQRFNDYVHKGSMPGVDPDSDEGFISEQLSDIFDTVVLRDALVHSGLPAGQVVDISRFLFSNIGCTTSCNNIALSLGLDQRAVRKCIDSLIQAFLVYKAERYDVRGKKLLKTHEKYYVSDTGIRNAVLGAPTSGDDGRLVENIIYLELIRRGYSVAVGKYGDSEIDFTARKGAVTEYYQVSLSILGDETYARETRPFTVMRGGGTRTVLTLDTFQRTMPEGTVLKNVITWLLEP